MTAMCFDHCKGHDEDVSSAPDPAALLDAAQEALDSNSGLAHNELAYLVPRLVGAARAVLGLADKWGAENGWGEGQFRASNLRAAVTAALAGEPQP